MAKEYYRNDLGVLYCGDTIEVLKEMPDECVDCIVTSPPYWGLRDYGVEGQIGLEPTLEEYLERMLAVTAELKRVLKPTGVLWWNHGDCYGGSGCGKGDYRNNNKRSLSNPNLYCEKPNPQLKLTPKCMALQNYRLILRMVDEQGWILRNIIIWHKPNHMPSSVKDRFTNAYEPVFMLVKSRKYWFDLDAVRKPYTQPLNRWGGEVLKAKGKSKWDEATGQKTYRDRNMRPNPLGKNPGDLWTIPTQPFPEAHFAIFPERLVEPMIKAGCPQWICKKCGKARERITEKKLIIHKEFKAYQNVVSGSKEMPAIPRARTGIEGHNEYHTIGWTDCGCGAGWEPGIVLDPFMGSGTTAVVAERLGRRWIGIELNPEYCEMSKRRILRSRGWRSSSILSYLTSKEEACE